MTSIEQLESVLCDPIGKCCITGSDEDRAIVDRALKELTAQRQWVGLTDEAIWSEYQTLWPFHPAEEPRMAKDIAKFARAIEAKLKEKNT